METDLLPGGRAFDQYLWRVRRGPGQAVGVDLAIAALAGLDRNPAADAEVRFDDGIRAVLQGQLVALRCLPGELRVARFPVSTSLASRHRLMSR